MKKICEDVLLFSMLFLLAGCGRKDGTAVPGGDGAQPAGLGSESEGIRLEAESVNPGSENGGSGSERIDPEPESMGSGLGRVDPEPESLEPKSKDAGSEPGNTISGSAGIKPEPEELLDAFLDGEIPAYYSDGTDTLMISDLIFDEEDYFSYSVGDRVDLDNDGEQEQIVNGPYGGIYFDARDGKVYILAVGEGTAGVLSYAAFENAVWVVHRDTSHAGRQMYWLDQYDGSGNIVDEFLLSAEYWGSPVDKYDEDSDFTYRGEEITMAEFEELRNKILAPVGE